MAKGTYKQIIDVANTYVDASKQAGTWSATIDNFTNCVEKIGKQISLDTNVIDYLPELDGEDMDYAATIEEWYQDMIIPQDFDETGANDKAPSYPTYAPTFYDYPLGIKTFKSTNSLVKYRKVVRSSEGEGEFIAKNIKKHQESQALFKLNSKLKLLGNLISKVEAIFTSATTITTLTAYAEGAYVKDGTNYAIVVKAIPNTNTTTSVATLASNGYVAICDDMVEVIAPPTDTETGEAFIKQIKKDVRKATRAKDGHSLSGRTIGANEGLYLFVLDGTQAELDVETLAGAFNQDKLAIPANMKEVESFGAYAGNAFAVLVDVRGVRLHSNLDLSTNTANGEGAFINIYNHKEFTGFISGNVYVKIYKSA